MSESEPDPDDLTSPDPGDLSPPNPADQAKAIRWSDDVTDFADFENVSGLPRVVRVEDRGTPPGLPQGSSSLPAGLRQYTNQPVLFYKRCSKRHVEARTIYHDAKGPYYEVGQTLVIPDDFDGWFEIVPPDFGRGPFCRTIGQLAEIMPRKFFTRTNIRAIRVADKMDDAESASGNGGTGDGSDNQSFKDRRVPAGTVLTVLGTFAGKWQTTAKTGLIKKKSKEWVTVDVNFLKCKDTDGQEILIPLTTRGRFYVVYQSGVKDSRAVYRIKDILTDFEIPIKVRMLFGKAPVVPCIFTGMLVLKEEVREDSIIASTIMYKRNALFEVPVSAKCDVKVATTEEDYGDMRTYIDANNLCRKYANAFSTLIKLSPELDTGQQPIQHIPTERRKTRDESLKTLDLITNISLTDDEPRDYFMDSSDTESIGSSDNAPLGMGQMMELREIVLPRASQNMSNV